MNTATWKRVAVAICAMVWCAGVARAQGKGGEGLPKDIVDAFKKHGAIYGGFLDDPFGRPQFVKGAKGAKDGLPGFQLRNFDAGKLPKLPDVPQPIGIDFFLSQANDADLKPLQSLKKLTVLNLGTTNVTDNGLKELKKLPNLTTLYLFGTKVTDKGLKELLPLKKLTTLDLEGNKITDAGAKELAKLKQLTALNLDVTEIADSGLGSLKQLPNLTSLKLGLTKITDKGLKEIPAFKKLTRLNLLGANVSVGAVQELQKAMPKCKIMR